MHRNLIAILRGITSKEAPDVTEALIDAGITQLEVPLNSPHPMETIDIMVKHYASHARIGAGTVLKIEDVDKLAEIGADMVISPNMNKTVIMRTKHHNMMSCPGVMSPTEAFDALAAGADMLKLFPANILGPSGVKALCATLPQDITLIAVGGIEQGTLAQWFQAGVKAFGIGSGLYKSGMTADDVGLVARQLVIEYDTLMVK